MDILQQLLKLQHMPWFCTKACIETAHQQMKLAN
jgi:hypothetical protein